MAAKEPNDFPDDIDPAVNGRAAGSPDTDNPLKKRARRRLVGAMALVLFAIVVLPVVMDREPAPGTADIQIRIPNPDGGALAGKLAPASKAKPVTESAPVPAVPIAAVPMAEEKPATSPPAKPEPVKEAKAPAAKLEEKSDKPANNKPEESKDVQLAAATSGKWEVQLGAYQNPGNVTLLMSKLKELKVPAYTEKFETPQGTRTRVRAGPFATKDAALAAQKRVRIIGVEGPVAPAAK